MLNDYVDKKRSILDSVYEICRYYSELSESTAYRAVLSVD